METPIVFLSVAEASADLYAARLIRTVHDRHGPAHFLGLTGPRSVEAGCRSLRDMTAGSAMLSSAFWRIPEVVLLLRRLRRLLAETRPHAAVLVDSPALNLRIAAICKQLSIKVLYYVAPQTWAWGEGRNDRIRRLVDRLAVILPFEQEYFARHGVAARFVGHPLLEVLAEQRLDAERISALRACGRPIIALLPGSRGHVIEEVLPGQFEVTRAVLARHADARVLVAAASPQAEDLARAIAMRLHAAGRAPSPQSIVFDHRYRGEVLAAADLALVASGTATLEVAYYATPMIVMYNHPRGAVGRWLYRRFGGRLIRIPYLSLPNILAGRQIVPEFMPFYRSTVPIAECALEMLSDEAGRMRRQRELAELVAPLVRDDVSRTVADELMALIRG